MIVPRGDVVAHDVHVAGNRTVKALVTPRGNAALVYGAHDLTEVTLVVVGRCPVANDVLGGTLCGCVTNVERALSVVRRAPLGVVVYLDPELDADVDDATDGYADVALFLACLPDVRRVYLPFINVAEASLLRQVLDVKIVHAPSLLPAESDSTWPGPERSHLRQLRRRATSMFWNATLWVENLVRRPR